MKKLLLIALLATALFPSTGFAARFYIDPGCATPGNGTTVTCSGAGAPLATIDAFTDVARAAGDVAIIKRGVATTTSALNDVIFTTSGTVNAPITLMADYDNAFGNFATSSQTVTSQFGSVFMATSASTTDMFPNQWIYIAGDCYENTTATSRNGCEYAYQIRYATSTGIQLYLPYKGNNAGSGKVTRVMPFLSPWNITTGDFQYLMSGDDYWYIKGVHLRSTDSAGAITFGANPEGVTVMDAFSETDGVTSLTYALPGYATRLSKFVGIHQSTSITVSNGATLSDGYIECIRATQAFSLAGSAVSYMSNIRVEKCTAFGIFNTQGMNIVYASNITGSTTPSISGGQYSMLNRSFYIEDFSGTPGLSKMSLSGVLDIASTTESDTSNLRSGGGPKNMKVQPEAGTGNVGVSSMNFPHSYLKLFEYPIYTDTTSRTYTVYFNSTTTSQWTNDPITDSSIASTTPELFIECDYYGGSSGAERRITMSNTTNDVDFNGSTAWQDISVTCQPAQSGILYLRAWYGKRRDTGSAMNQFYVDLTPVISP